MAAGTIRFYLDENVQLAVAEQLRARGIDVVTARELGALGDSDANHLGRATEMGRVLCTYDADFLRLAAAGIEHAGIVVGRWSQHGIGDWVRGLELLHTVYAAEDMLNHIEYL